MFGLLLSRSQTTICYQTQGACQNNFESACKRAMKTRGTSPLSLICLYSSCPLTLYPKSSGEHAKCIWGCDIIVVAGFCCLLLAANGKLFSCFSSYKQLHVKHEPLQLITPQFETPLPQLQPAVSFSLAFYIYLHFPHIVFTKNESDVILRFWTSMLYENTFYFKPHDVFLCFRSSHLLSEICLRPCLSCLI